MADAGCGRHQLDFGREKAPGRHRTSAARPRTAASTACARQRIRVAWSPGTCTSVSAGLSAYGYPMTAQAQLPPLLWSAIEAGPAALAELHNRNGRSGSVKEILTSTGNVQLGWQPARKYARVRSSFQHAFVQLDVDPKPSRAHRDLARLIRLRRIDVVISYNWDS